MKRSFLMMLIAIILVFGMLMSTAALADQTEVSEIQQEEVKKPTYKTLKSKWVDSLKLPKALRTLTLSEKEAASLIEKNPDEIAERVTSLADALVYLKQAKLQCEAPFVGTPQYNNDPGYTKWAFSRSGAECLERNDFCCCGGAANILCYLLADNYDEVGQVRWIGGGNHTITYVKADKKYYVFDLTRLCGNKYKGQKALVTTLDDIKDYWENIPSEYLKGAKNQGSDIVFVFSYECDGAGYPWCIAGDSKVSTKLVFPEGAKITEIYNKDSKYSLGYKKVNGKIPGWND